MMVKKLPVILTEEEVLKLFSMIYNPKHKLQVQLLYYCGLRISEMLALKSRDIDLKQEVLKVVQGKGGKDRFVPLPKPLLPDLRAFMLSDPEYLHNTEGSLFVTTARNTQGLLSRLTSKFNQDKPVSEHKHLHPHIFRHSYATHVLEKTNNLALVKDLLGHTDIKTTQIYTHMTTKAKKAGIGEVWK